MFLLLSAASLMALPILQTGSLEPSFRVETKQGRGRSGASGHIGCGDSDSLHPYIPK